MNSLGNPKSVAMVLVAAALGGGTAFAAGACGEDRGGDVEVQPGGTGPSGGSTGKTDTGKTGTGSTGTETGKTGTGATDTGSAAPY